MIQLNYSQRFRWIPRSGVVRSTLMVVLLLGAIWGWRSHHLAAVRSDIDHFILQNRKALRTYAARPKGKERDVFIQRIQQNLIELEEHRRLGYDPEVLRGIQVAVREEMARIVQR